MLDSKYFSESSMRISFPAILRCNWSTFFKVHGFRSTFYNHRRISKKYLESKALPGNWNKLHEEGYWKDFQSSRNRNFPLNFLQRRQPNIRKTISAHTKSTDLTFWTPQKNYSSRDTISLIPQFNLKKFVDRKLSPPLSL